MWENILGTLRKYSPVIGWLKLYKVALSKLAGAV